jgi:hypothetical protein
MEILEQTTPTEGQKWRVVIPSSVLAAISQLTDSEQEGIRQTFRILQRQGLPTHSADVEVMRVKQLGEVFVLRASVVPDIRVYARRIDDATIQVEDIVRERTVRSLFHAF